MSLIYRTARTLAMPACLYPFLRRGTGAEYGIGPATKLKLLRRFVRNAREITTATGWHEHLTLATYLLSVPKSMPGAVIECGCFKGSSTASLSLVCKAIGRRLVVCDSFEGLPEVTEHDRVHVSLVAARYETYAKGDYTARIDEVKANVARYGALECCSFVKGYFQDTLPHLQEQAAFVFLDVDLHDSLRTCLLNLWPRLEDGAYLFTHEAQQLPFASIFFDKAWWNANLQCNPPGLVGAGCGLPTGPATGSGLGFAVKLPPDFDPTTDHRFQHFVGDPTRTRP